MTDIPERDKPWGRLEDRSFSLCYLGRIGFVCQRCSRRITGKNGDDGKVAAAGIPSQREQMGGGDFEKVEAANRRREDRKEKRGKAAKVHFAVDQRGVPRGST